MVNVLDWFIFTCQKLRKVSLAIILQAELILFGNAFCMYPFSFSRIFLKAYLELSLSRKELLPLSIATAELWDFSTICRSSLPWGGGWLKGLCPALYMGHWPWRKIPESSGNSSSMEVGCPIVGSCLGAVLPKWILQCWLCLRSWTRGCLWARTVCMHSFFIACQSLLSLSGISLPGCRCRSKGST